MDIKQFIKNRTIKEMNEIKILQIDEESTRRISNEYDRIEHNN